MPDTLSTSDAFWQQPVTRQLQQQLTQFAASQRFLVACSGGRDSLSLACALNLLCPGRVRIVHVNHQLQSPAAGWAAWLARQCQHWGLSCDIYAVEVGAGNVEEQARKARYQALLEHIEADEILVLGHHQQDQAETVFLRLISGSGVVGLSAMKMLEQRGSVLLWRPLLQCSRQQITQLATLICPDYIDDPANTQDNFDRVFLRQQVWPLLQTRWPAMQKSMARTALLMQDSADILQQVAAQDMATCGNAQILEIEKIQALTAARQRLLLSRWMQGQEQYAPAFHLVAQLQHTLMAARQDAVPKIQWNNWQFRRHQQFMYRLPVSLPVAVDESASWDKNTTFELPSGCWQWQQQDEGFPEPLITQPWQLYVRQGGESIHLRGRAGHWPLKKSLQAAGIAPWQREQVHILDRNNMIFGVFTPQGFWPTAQAPWQAGGWLPVLQNVTLDANN